ncbi:hypothetical protein Tco_0788125 [Tanacetum coccineum]
MFTPASRIPSPPSASGGWDRLVSEPLVIENWSMSYTIALRVPPYRLHLGYVLSIEMCCHGGVRVVREDDRGVTEGREDVREVFQQRRSGAKRKLSRCGRNQLGNEPILALPEGADDFIVYYDARSKDLEACLEKGRSEFDFEAKYHLGKANVDVVPWNRKKE